MSAQERWRTLPPDDRSFAIIVTGFGIAALLMFSLAVWAVLS